MVQPTESAEGEISLRPDTGSNRRLGSGRFSGRQEAVERLVDGPRRMDDRHGGGYYDTDEAPPRPRRVIVLDRDRDRSRERLNDRNADRGDRNNRWNNYERYGDAGGSAGSKHHQARNFHQPPISLRNLKNERPERRGGSRFPRREENEPEWMSAQVEEGELMELRGFDDSPEKERQPRSEKTTNKPRANNNNNNDDDHPKNGGDHSAQNPPANGTQEVQSQAPPKPSADADMGFNLDDILQCDFIGTDQISQILSENPVSAPLRGASKQPEIALEGNSKGSRFSQFFKRPEQPEQGPSGGGGTGEIESQTSLEKDHLSRVIANDTQEDSRRSSIQDELNLNGRGRLHRFGESVGQPLGPNIRIPSPIDDAQSACYFAPISPAAKTVNREDRAAIDPPVNDKPSNNPLMDLLKGNGKGINHLFYLICYVLMDFINLLGEVRGSFGPPMPVGINSVEELELNLKEMVRLSGENQPLKKTSPNPTAHHEMEDQNRHSQLNKPRENTRGVDAGEDMSAFKKFVSFFLVSGSISLLA